MPRGGRNPWAKTVADLELATALCALVAADEPLRERFFAKVDQRTVRNVDECWIWTAALNDDGYGNFSVRIDGRERTIKAHRVSYFIAYPWPFELYLDHVFPVCRGRYCVNPMHLDPVTKAENDARASGTTSAVKQRTNRSLHLQERDLREELVA